MLLRVIAPALLAIGLPAWASAPPKPLAILKPTLSQFEDGPAVGSDFPFLPGDTIFFSFLIQGYKASEDARIHLQYQIDALDPDGVRLVETLRRDVKTELAPEDKDWMPKARQSIVVPPLIQPGLYQIVVSVKDLLADREVRTELPFRVGGRQVAPSDTLVLRNFRFLRSEDDPQPLVLPVYRPGDTLWARFEIVGFRCAEQNRIHVEYGLSVLGPTGKTLYSEPRAAVEEAASFYPKHYLPGSLSLNLQPNAQRGDYTIVLTLRDDVGKQVFQARYGFKIE